MSRCVVRCVCSRLRCDCVYASTHTHMLMCACMTCDLVSILCFTIWEYSTTQDATHRSVQFVKWHSRDDNNNDETNSKKKKRNKQSNSQQIQRKPSTYLSSVISSTPLIATRSFFCFFIFHSVETKEKKWQFVKWW